MSNLASTILQILTLAVAGVGALLGAYNAHATRELQRQSIATDNDLKTMQQAIEASKVSATDPTTKKLKEWATIVVEQKLAKERGQTYYQKWLDIHAQQKAFLELRGLYCYRPPEQYLESAAPYRQLTPNRDDGGASIDHLMHFMIDVKLDYHLLAIKHNTLIEFLRSACGSHVKPRQ